MSNVDLDAPVLPNVTVSATDPAGPAQVSAPEGLPVSDHTASSGVLGVREVPIIL